MAKRRAFRVRCSGPGGISDSNIYSGEQAACRYGQERIADAKAGMSRTTRVTLWVREAGETRWQLFDTLWERQPSEATGSSRG